jgi:hypothetical protein
VTQHDDVKVNDKLLAYSPQVGWLHAVSAEDKQAWSGLAYLNVSLNSEKLKGVSEMVISTNSWEIYLASNPEGTEKALAALLKPEYSR